MDLDFTLRILGYALLAGWWFWIEFGHPAAVYFRYPPARYSIIRLYWQRPAADPTTNILLYWFSFIPVVLYGFVCAVGVLESIDQKVNWLEVDAILICLALCNVIVIPKSLVVSPQGIFWNRLYPWEHILGFTWKEETVGNFFCFTLDPNKVQRNTVIRVGPITALQREYIDEALENLLSQESSTASESE